MLVNFTVQKRENANFDFDLPRLIKTTKVEDIALKRFDLYIKYDLVQPNPNTLPICYFLSLPLYFIR
jgi:hypothetical protein